MKNVFLFLVWLAFSLVVVSGCSDNSPLAPGQDSPSSSVIPSAQLIPTEPLKFNAKIMTVDQNTRMLTLQDRPEVIVALMNCEIVRLNNGQETPIPFEDVGPGEEAQFYCNRVENNYMYAYRIRIYGDGDCSQYEVAFRDTIASINYEAGTFTVVGRTETIEVDENTIIWARTISKPKFCNTIKENNQTSGPIGTTSKPSPNNFSTIGVNDTTLLFTDLEVGDIVEVKADVVDETTLLAVVIKVAECSYVEKQCIEFTATLASVDCEARTVTFVENDYSGVVCNGAILTNTADEPLTLCDFAAGQTVWVKGHILEDGSLKISMMILQ